MVSRTLRHIVFTFNLANKLTMKRFNPYNSPPSSLQNCLFRSKRLADGFTLIELLVVIAIIAVLAAIALGMLGRVRQSADATKSMANLRSIGMLMARYSGENNMAMLPPRVNWDTVLIDSLSSRDSLAVWRAPGDNYPRTRGDRWPGDPGFIAPARSYCLNARIHNFNGQGGLYPGHSPDNSALILKIERPAKLWVMTELFQTKAFPYDLVMGQGSAAFMYSAPAKSNGANVQVLFADGHVVSHPWKAQDPWFDQNIGQ